MPPTERATMSKRASSICTSYLTFVQPTESELIRLMARRSLIARSLLKIYGEMNQYSGGLDVSNAGGLDFPPSASGTSDQNKRKAMSSASETNRFIEIFAVDFY